MYVFTVKRTSNFWVKRHSSDASENAFSGSIIAICTSLFLYVHGFLLVVLYTFPGVLPGELYCMADPESSAKWRFDTGCTSATGHVITSVGESSLG